METGKPCTACSWTVERQKACHYNSHVKLFYGVADRGAWSLGSQYILKQRSSIMPLRDSKTTRFLQTVTTIPVPMFLAEWTETDGPSMEIMSRIDGITLKEAWPNLSDVDRVRIAKQTADYLVQLRGLRSDRVQSIDGGPLYNAFLFRNEYGHPNGPFSSDDELWEGMAKALEGLPDKVRRYLRRRMPAAGPYTFTHGDLSAGNIIVKEGNVTGIIDWETSGYLPVWWEFTAMGVYQDDDDRAWKTLLQKYMDDYTDAHAFWREYTLLCLSLSDSDERGAKLLREIEAQDD